MDKSFQGEVVFSPGYSVGYLPQEPQLDDNLTVKEVVSQGVQEVVDILKEYEEVNMKFAEPMSDDEMNKLIERQGELTELIDQHDAWELDNKLERAMDALRCPEGDTPVKNLSGGERRRVALCRLLLSEPDILLLDEPTNHLDAESVEWLEMHLRQYKGTVIAVTHSQKKLNVNTTGSALTETTALTSSWVENSAVAVKIIILKAYLKRIRSLLLSLFTPTRLKQERRLC